MALPTSQGLVQRFAMGLYGVQLGSETMGYVLDEVKTNGGITKIDSIFNWYYAVSFGGKTTAQVADMLAANLGIAEGKNGLTAGFVTFAKDYMAGVLNSTAAGERGAAVSKIVAAWEGLAGNAEVGAAVAAWQANVDGGLYYAAHNTADVAVGAAPTPFVLTSSIDTITGTAGNDVFVANFNGESNTLQSGDTINGGAGTDTLKAIIDSPAFSATPTVSGVETITITAQNDAGRDSGQNNVSGKEAVQLDFGRVSGVKTIQNIDSRADLSVEDVRIQDSEITKDITIVMRDTDPGAVDFGVYFDQNSLRNVSTSTSTIRLEVMDTNAVVAGKAPLLNSPYGGFKFTATDVSGVAQVFTLQSEAIDAAQTYAELVAAFQVAADEAFGAGAVTVTLGANFTATDTTSGTKVTGSQVNLTANGKYTFSTPAGSGWIANGVVPANSGLHTNFSTGGATSTDLVTSTIVLDNVGRGSNGGDLIVGGLSTGITSSSKGVQQFDITVEDNSKLSNILSTNNTLQVVTIKNGKTDVATDAYVTTEKDAGYLKVGISNDQDSALQSGPQMHEDSAAGFNDVRVIDGSAMTGKLEFTAAFTGAAVAKYLDLKDTAAPAGDNIAVTYTGGANADKMAVNLDQAAVASNSNINVGREDFTFTFNGGAGKDEIDVSVNRHDSGEVEGGALGNDEAWYTNQKINANITINGGEGDDTIRKPGAGDFKLNGDAGNDTIYADNSGKQVVSTLDATGVATPVNSNAVWVFNTADQTNPNALARDLGNLLSAARETVGSFGAKLTVNFRGLTKQVAVADTADYKLSDLEINQAIKEAINGDAVLNKLLVAQDGPSGTLVVTSLIDGVHATNALSVTLAGPAAADISAATVTAYNAANGTNLADAAAVSAAIAANLNAIDNDFGAALADENGVASAIAGSNSTTTSDNTITGGAGDDVIVLGTTGVATAAAAPTAAELLASSNDTVVFSGTFGADTVVNFVAAAGEIGANAGIDTLDFTALGGKLATAGADFINTAGAAGLGAVSNDNGSIIIDDLVTAVAGNDTAVKVKALFADDATAGTMVYVAVDANNVGTVYQVVDGTGAADLAVTVVGTVDLADTAWSTLTAGNFA